MCSSKLTLLVPNDVVRHGSSVGISYRWPRHGNKDRLRKRISGADHLQPKHDMGTEGRRKRPMIDLTLQPWFGNPCSVLGFFLLSRLCIVEHTSFVNRGLGPEDGVDNKLVAWFLDFAWHK